jgi:hypothetical protein
MLFDAPTGRQDAASEASPSGGEISKDRPERATCQLPGRRSWQGRLAPSKRAKLMQCDQRGTILTHYDLSVGFAHHDEAGRGNRLQGQRQRGVRRAWVSRETGGAKVRGETPYGPQCKWWMRRMP